MRKVTPEQAEEIRRCIVGHDNDIGAVYWLKNYAYLKHTTKGKIRWDKPYPYQVEVLEALNDGEDVFVNKSRRVGASWTACAFILWKCMFHPDMSALLLSRKEFYAKGLLKRIKFMYDNLPAWMRPRRKVNSQSELSFEFRKGDDVAESNIISLTTTDESGRGEDAAIVLMDEAASIPNADDTWAAVSPTAAFGGQRIVVSTPNGVGGFFHRIVSQLKAGFDIGFRYIEAHWKRNCGLTDKWFKAATVGMSQTTIMQEFELVFLSTNRPFFDIANLEKCYRPPDKFPEIGEMMRPTAVNFSGVDTAEGHSTVSGEPDYHSVVVLNDMGVQVLAFHSNTMARTEFAGHMEAHGDGMVHVEGIPSKVHREYPGYMSIEIFGTGDVTAANHIVPDDNVSEMREHRQTNSSKMRLLKNLRNAINGVEIIVTDKFTYQCLQTFEDQTSGAVEKAGAAAGAFDDPVIALALAYNELRRYGGVQWHVPQSTTDGRRVIGVRREEDLAPSELDQVLAVGKPRGPMVDALGNALDLQVPGAGVVMEDSFEEVRSGRIRLRPPGM
jgi:hypothetical protein